MMQDLVAVFDDSYFIRHVPDHVKRNIIKKHFDDFDTIVEELRKYKSEPLPYVPDIPPLKKDTE
jgi:hypothetical protein